MALPRLTLGWKLLLAAALVVTAAGALVVLELEALVRLAMTPRAPFDPATAPPPPDYALAGSWSALPGAGDAGAAADVFYVHPTSYVGDRWNAPTTDAALNAATDRVATGIQATAFTACCAVYAPRYRQANGTAFTAPSADGERALDVAYADVRRAFAAFLERRGSQRPFILAGHSQGSVLAERLLVEQVAGTALRETLVAAYLPGGAVTVAGLQERAPDVPPCATPEDLHCVTAWNARGPHYVPNTFEVQRPDRRPRLCTNPLSWRLDGVAVAAARNRGAVFLESADPAPRPGFADAQCVDGTLVVRTVGVAPRDFPSRVLDRVLGAGNYHPVEYQLFFMDLRDNAQQRVAAYLRERP